MKHLRLTILATCLVFAAVGCSGGSSDTSLTNAAAPPSEGQHGRESAPASKAAAPGEKAASQKAMLGPGAGAADSHLGASAKSK